MEMIYMDNAATTKMSETAQSVMVEAARSAWGNPSSMHTAGRAAAKYIREARQICADLLGADRDEIYFTAGGSEADNWAIRGAAILGRQKGKMHLITSAVEHHAVLHTMQALEKEGFRVTYLPVDAEGLVSPEAVREALRDETCLVSVMAANNEIGTVEPIQDIGKICREKDVLFHTDAVQALGHIEINVEKQNIDLLSASAHKFNGPKGVGLLYCRKGIRLPNLIEGGAQERGRRGGTENVPGIAAMAAALREACAHLEQESIRVSKLREKLITGILQIPETRINGSLTHRLPGNINACFGGIEGESLLISLDMAGVCASSGSACTSGSLDPSHVLLAIGLPHEIAHGSLRLSLGRENTEADVDYVLKQLPAIVKRLRDMSPVWERMCKEKSFLER